MLYRLASIALPLLTGALFTQAALAVGATAVVGATVVAPVLVSMDASTQLLVSSTTGLLILGIPGGGGSAGSAPSTMTMTLTASGPVASGGLSVFSASDSAGLAAVIRQVATSGGTLSTGGTLSGTGVQIVVLQAPSGGERGTVTAIVTYN